MNEVTKLIPWWDWLLCDSRTLRVRGFDPRERLAKTGHERALSPQWARSIGMWCRADPQAIMKTVFPKAQTKDEKRKARTAYDLFKYRHRLLVKSKFIKQNMAEPNRSVFMQIGAVMVATIAHARIHGHLIADETGALSVGAAARQAVLYLPEDNAERNARIAEGRERKEEPIGILPVEALLYYYTIEYILETAMITPIEWHSVMSDQDWFDRVEYWKRYNCDAIVRLPQIALDLYPPDDA